MSLSWRDRLYVVLAPARADVMRVAGWSRRSAVYTELDTQPGMQPAWQGAVRALAQSLPELAPRGGHCHVVLSNHFCRYAMVPGNAGLADVAEMEAYARLKLDETYGAGVSTTWEVRLARGHAGAPRLACAVDSTLMEALREACTSAGVKLASVRPLLAASFDYSRPRFASARFWFAAAEEGRLCLAAVDNRCWRSVTSQRIGSDVCAELQAMLKRALVSAPGMQADNVYLFSRDQAAERARALPGVTVLPLPEAHGGSSHAQARERVFA